MRKKRLTKPYQSIRIKERQAKVEKKKNNYWYLYFIGGVTILTLSGINIARTFNASPTKPPVVHASTYNINDEQKFWTTVLDKTPSYVPGLLRLAHIQYELGNQKEARALVSRAAAINQNTNEVKEAMNLIPKN